MKVILSICLTVLLQAQLFSQDFAFKKDMDSLRIWMSRADTADMLGPDYYDQEENSQSIPIKCIELLSDPLFPVDSMKKIFPNYLESRDKELVIFQWENRTGGTYRPFISIFCHQRRDKRLVELTEYDASFYKVYDRYNECCGQRYFLHGSVRGCSYCFSDMILVLDIENGSFEEISSCFLYDRDWGSLLNLDLDNNIISFDFNQSNISELTIYQKDKKVYSLQDDLFKDLKFSRNCRDDEEFHFKGVIVIDEYDLFQFR